MNEDILVDIPICVYNHEKFIAQALDGVLKQVTSFKYRIIIGEDRSTDSSREIVKRYAEKHPERFHVFFHDKNLGPFENSRILFKNCTAKYIALCDGDDYWTDANKLQRQVDFLEANPSIGGCFHDVIAVDENDNLLRENYYDSPQERYNQHDSITKHGGRYATCSLVFRSLVLKDWPAWFSKAISDYAIDILLTDFGDLVHLTGTMGAYRIHKGGMWQGNQNPTNLIQSIGRYEVLLHDNKFKNEYGAHFKERISKSSYSISIDYKKKRNWSGHLKYAWKFFKYTGEKQSKNVRFLIGALSFGPKLYLKKFFRKAFFLALRLKPIENFFTENFLKWIAGEDRRKITVLNKFRKDLVKETFTYPSVVNNGYLHIQRTIDIVKSRDFGHSLIIDVGAAGGETCIMFSKAFPGWRIYGFEPIRKTFNRLETNTESIYNIRIYNTALGSSKGAAEINVTNRITASSLLDTREEQAFEGSDYFKILDKETISIDKLDNFVTDTDEVALIKIDVQGFELEVLKGALNTLKKTCFVLLEMQNHHIYSGAPLYHHLDEFMRDNEFELFEIIPSIREAMQVKEFDALYVNKRARK